MMEHKTNMPRDHPILSKGQYAIVPQVDGTVDIYLAPRASTDTMSNFAIVGVVRGVIPFPEIEEDIRARYDSWCDSAEMIHI